GAVKRDPLLERVVHVLDDRNVREREKGIGIRAQHWMDDAALDQIPQVILAQRAVAEREIAHRVVLPLQRFGRWYAGEQTELLFAHNRNLQLFGPFQLLALVVLGGRPETFGADDDHRRLRVDFVRGRAAKPRHQRARVLAAKRTQFSGENDELTGEW